MTTPTQQTNADTFGTGLPRTSYWRAVLVGTVLVPLNSYWVMACELRWHNIITINPLFVTPIFYLFLMYLVNAFLKRRLPRFALDKSEALVIYVMLVMSCTIVTHDWLLNLVSTMAYPAWFATPENNWQQIMFPYLPRWAFAWDKSLIEGYYQGFSSMYDPQILKMWATPVIVWTIFTLVVGWMLLCLTVMIRKAWMEDTKLSFPIVRLPSEILQQDGPDSIIRSKALWWGFAIILALDVSNGLHQWFPNIPYLEVRTPLMFSTPPWTAAASATSPIFLTIFPFAIGTAFLVPLDISFSCWFFYLFYKLQAVMSFQTGYASIPDFPFENEQALGAWLAFGIFLLWSVRKHLLNAALIAFGKSRGSDAAEPISYKAAFWGFSVTCALFVGFWIVAGMKPILSLMVLVAFVILGVCLARVRAEAGAQPTIRALEPKSLFRLFGSEAIGPASLAAAALSHWHHQGNRSHMMPNQLDAFKLAGDHGLKLRSLVFPIMIAILLASIFGIWTSLHIFYQDGALAKCRGYADYAGTDSYAWMANAVTQGIEPQPGRWWAALFGSGLVGFLALMRIKFVGFPFHPLGYCAGAAMMWHWFPMFLAWFLKLIILRYGGLKFYRRVLPFFLGMILGDYVGGASWALIGIAFDIPVYQIWGS